MFDLLLNWLLPRALNRVVFPTQVDTLSLDESSYGDYFRLIHNVSGGSNELQSDASTYRKMAVNSPQEALRLFIHNKVGLVVFKLYSSL